MNHLTTWVERLDEASTYRNLTENEVSRPLRVWLGANSFKIVIVRGFSKYVFTRGIAQHD